VFPKEEKKGGEWGVRYGDESAGVESRPDARKKEKRTVHKDGECGTISRTCEERVLMGPKPTTSAGHAVTATQCA